MTVWRWEMLLNAWQLERCEREKRGRRKEKRVCTKKNRRKRKRREANILFIYWPLMV